MPRSTRYRGRKRLASMLASIGITILVVSVLGGTAYLFLRDYVSLTENGVLLSLPFMNRSAVSPPPASPSPSPQDDSLTVVIESVVSPSPSPPPSPEPEEIELRAVFLPQNAMSDAAKLAELSALCETGGVDTVVFEVKSLDGVIVTNQPPLANALTALEGKAKLVGYISVLHDNTVTRQKTTFGIKHTKGVNWLDANKSRWINPYLPETRSWLAEQVAACAELPFDSLLLDTLWLPTEGQLDFINWGTDEPPKDALTTLLGELTAAAAQPCWAVMQTDVLLGNQPQADNAGQNLANFEQVCEMLFVRLPAESPSELYGDIAAAGVADLLPIIQLPEPSESAEADFSDVTRIALGSFNSYIAVSASANYPAEAFAQ